MKRKEQSVLLAGLLVLGLSACESMRMNDGDADTAGVNAADIPASTAYGTGREPSMAVTGSAGTTAGTSGAASSSAYGASGAAGATSGTPNVTVTSIEVVPLQSADAATGAGTVAGAAVGGTGATMTGDRVYRVTLRADDGTIQSITQEWVPTFTTGDRVQLTNGAIQR